MSQPIRKCLERSQEQVPTVDAEALLAARLAPDMFFLYRLRFGLRVCLDVNADEPLAHELPNGMILDLSAEQYARDWSLAQFYFHLMTAYSILRSEKIELGKADYIAHMFPYIRPETIPKG